MVNCYLPTGKQATCERTELMEYVFSFVATLGSVPVVICGDFQSPPEENPSIVAALLSDDWVDVYREQQLLHLTNPSRQPSRKLIGKMAIWALGRHA